LPIRGGGERRRRWCGGGRPWRPVERERASEEGRCCLGFREGASERGPVNALGCWAGAYQGKVTKF
jgi:hypothetical protein